MPGEFRLGEWLVRPQLNLLVRGEHEVSVEPKVMDVLVYLAENAGEVLPKERIIGVVWADAFVGDEALTYSISELRKALSDDARSPRFIQTIPRRGYRLIAPVSFPEPEPDPQPPRSMTALFVSAAVVVLAIVALFLWRGPSASSDDPAPQSVRFHERPPGVTFGPVDTLALSPDDKHLAFTGLENGERRLWVRPLDSFSAYALDDTENAFHPFWSPDGREIGFFADHSLKAIDVADGIVRVVSRTDGWNGSWSTTGQILIRVHSSREPGFWVVSASGGEPEILKLHQTGTTNAGQFLASSPRFFPDGNRFLSFQGDWSIWLSDLSSRTARLLIDNSTGAVPVGPDLVVFSRDNLLLAQTFDTTSEQLTGSALTITDGVMPRRWHSSYFDATPEYLAYRVEASRQEQLVWLDREGRRLSTVGEAAPYLQISLSPDEEKVVATLDPSGTFKTDLHLIDLITEVTSRLTTRQDYDADPVWHPDSDRIAYSTGLEGGSVRVLHTGEAQDEHLFSVEGAKDGPDLETKAEDWSSDGKTLLVRGPANRVSRVSLDSMSSRLWLDSEGLVDQCKSSPNGRWIAYGSNESGNWEVYVASFPEFGRKQQISRGGGVQPRWRSDGRELFYLSQDGRMMSVPVTASNDELQLDPPEPLFQSEIRIDPGVDQYAVTRDGRRFLVIQPLASEEPIAVIKNWRAGLQF